MEVICYNGRGASDGGFWVENKRKGRRRSEGIFAGEGCVEMESQMPSFIVSSKVSKLEINHALKLSQTIKVTMLVLRGNCALQRGKVKE